MKYYMEYSAVDQMWSGIYGYLNIYLKRMSTKYFRESGIKVHAFEIRGKRNQTRKIQKTQAVVRYTQCHKYNVQTYKELK